MKTTRTATLLATITTLALAGACSGSSDDGGVAGNEVTGGAGGSSGASGSGGSAASGSGGTAASSGASGAGGAAASGGSGAGTFDAGGGGGDAGPSGCQKVDFLFVIDSSVSMRDQQAALIASFPGFIDTIRTTLAQASDYHIMVVDTDAESRCTPSNCMTGDQRADDLCIMDGESGHACTATFTACDSTLGAGVVHPAGEGSSNKQCAIFGGNRYMIEGEPMLNSTFACVAQVGLAGHPAERPMDAMVAALASDINGAGGCNEGFLRDDAILVVSFISDDPNREDAGQPQDWYDAVVAAKGGNADSVVVLGITPDFDGCRPDNKPDAGKHWTQFVNLWGNRGLSADICSLDYTGFFQQAVSVIDEACDEFNPPQ